MCKGSHELRQGNADPDTLHGNHHVDIPAIASLAACGHCNRRQRIPGPDPVQYRRPHPAAGRGRSAATAGDDCRRFAALRAAVLPASGACLSARFSRHRAADPLAERPTDLALCAGRRDRRADDLAADERAAADDSVTDDHRNLRSTGPDPQRRPRWLGFRAYRECPGATPLSGIGAA